MPPSLRRRAPPYFPDPISESDNEIEGAEIVEDEEDVMVDQDVGIDVDDEEGEDEEDDPLASGPPSPAHSGLHSHTHSLHSPIPPHFREISTLASWTVSSSKPGCSIPQLRSPSTNLFWQSDGPQPHYLNIHFFKLVRIVGLRLFLDFEADESYTPTRIAFLAGSGGNDLVEWGEMRLEQPRGWVWADFSGVGEADSEDEEDDEDSDAEEVAAGLDQALQSESDTSDSGNNEPAGPSTAAGGGDSMHLDPHIQVQEHTTPIQNPHHTPVQNHNHNQTGTPTSAAAPIHRSQPRRPLHALAPNQNTPPYPKPKKTKLPVLRCHLVQIKIMENHQNGKDTHLRGLQIFARDSNSAKERAVRTAIAPRKSLGGVSIGEGKRKSLAGGVGGGIRGLAKSSWDVEPSIR